MPLTRLDNLISSKTGRYLYVSPDDFNASDELDNRGNSPNRPFVTIQRAFIEVARYSYAPGIDNDRFDEFTIMLMPGDHYIDNRPGLATDSGTPVFSFDQFSNAWTDSSVVDLSNPDNVLHKFNDSKGGCIVPRGCSLIGYDLRRTIIRPLYVPDPADKECERTSIFNVTGGAYIWQFTIKDGDITTKSPLYDANAGVGKVYYRKGDNTNLAIPEYSHHKITVFQYAEKPELDLYYTKVAKSFAQYQPTIDDQNEFGSDIRESRIVGPLSDLRSIESLQVVDSSPVGTVTVNVTTKIAHGYIKDQFFAVQNNGLDDALNGTFSVSSINTTNRRRFSFQLPGTVSGLGLQNQQTYNTGNGLNTGAYVQAEVDSVQSASPYMFNLSIRSTWGICGLLADGSKATGFKSMVCAQYTGVSLQKDDRAFIRYDKYTNTWNQASLSDAFATVPYHTKGDAYWKDDWRNFHIRATNDSFIQCVSIFAVGFADHFLMESGGDMSITNSNSNFGNTSLHAIGHKGYAFAQDKGGYVDSIIPPRKIVESSANNERVDYYTFDVQASNPSANNTKLYFGGTGVTDPLSRPAATLEGYRIGARSKESIFVELDPYAIGSGKVTPSNSIYDGTLEPSGFKTYPSSLQILNPTTVVVDNKNQDAANRIEDNKDLIAQETYGYITTKYPALLSKNIIISKCQRDVGLVLDAVISDLRLGGNINTIQAAESYFSAGQLNYIDGEKFETIEGFEYARDLAIAAARNWSFLQTGCSVTSGSSTVTVPSTTGLSIGMKVEEYSTVTGNTGVDTSSLTTSNIPSNTYIRNIVNATTVELGSVVGGARSYLSTGTSRNATGTNTSTNLLFKLEDNNGDRKGIWATDIGTVDTTITQDTVYPACSTVASAISTLMDGLKTIINQGINPVGDRFADAHDLLLANKNYIADVAVKDMLIEYPSHTVPGGNVNCSDDIVDIVEAIAYNVKFGANNQVWDAANLYVTGAHLAGEEEQSIYAFRVAKVISQKVIQNQSYTPRAGVTTSYTQTTDTSITTDPNPSGGTFCADVISAMDTLYQLVEYGIDTAGANQQQLGQFTPSNAVYDAATGDLTLTMAAHGLSSSNKVEISQDALTFTCGMDANSSNHTYPRVGDPAFKNKLLSITDLTTDTVKVNVGPSPIVGYNISDASYTATTGVLELTVGSNNLNVGDTVKLDNNALTFTCGMDNNASTHSYPRPTDPKFNTSVAISSVGQTSHTITDATYTPSTGDLVATVNSHGFHARSQHTAGNAIYNPFTGKLTITVSNHTFSNGDSVRIADNSLTFTCAKDSNATNHSYPRSTDPASGKDLVISGVTQNTFDVTIGVSSDKSTHTFVSAGTNGITRVGTRVKLDDSSITFTCAKDSNATNHAYPRATDDASGEWLEITAKDTNTFTINIGQSPDTSAHAFVSAVASGLKAQTGTIQLNVGTSPAVTYTPSAAVYNQTTGDMTLTIGVHSLVAQSQFTPAAGTTYDPSTGIMSIRHVSHGLVVGDMVKIADGAVSFTCLEDSNNTTHAYPRASDPASGTSLEVLAITADTFDVQVLTTVPSTNITAHTFVSSVANSITKAGQSVRLAADSLTFTCTKDSNATNHTYPRSTDPAYNTALPILAVGNSTITINVGADADPANHYDHTFVSATAGAVTSGGDYAHTFSSAKPFGLKTGGDYPHTFVTAATNGVTGYATNAGQFAATTKTSPSQNVVARNNPSTSTDQFAQRATLFTIDAGGINPHKFETGTPVRLVARAKVGKTPDERDVRLPQGFQPNRTYFVIAPGRNTQPFNYNDAAVYNGIFDGGDQTKLMLAESLEAAAAGIYIYSPETEALDADVEILVQQFTLDTTYDLHEYKVTFSGTSSTVLKTDVAHIFDKPSSSFAADDLQKVFFRSKGSDGGTGTLPTGAGSGASQILSTTEYYVRYESDDTFKIFATAQDAITGSPEIQLANNPSIFWYVLANKRTSPMRFDPTYIDTSASRVPAIPDGLWYLNLKDETADDNNILSRLHVTDYSSSSGRLQTTDSYYNRTKDDRKADDRIYRLRYVQPKQFPGSIRKPNNGFVIKLRTDDKRNLIPQNITLEPVGGSPTKAVFRNPQSQNASEDLGMSKTAFDTAVQQGTLQDKYIYDPDNNPCVVNTDSYLRFSIRSAREISVASNTYLQVTAFDHRVDDTNAPSLKNTVFHTVEIDAPQGGAFAASKVSSTPANIVQWSGGSSGFGYLHAYFTVSSKHYIILKDVSARPTYDPLVSTRFQQGAVYADQQSDVNGGRDSKTNNLYVVGGSNVFTLTPGDTVNDTTGNQYKIVAVEDVPQIDDTFYIFDSETIQERVAGQQDGIYYLTAVRGNISPLPRGAGVGQNFQNFKFSQPISSLYPLDYKNDPTWYQVIDNNGTKDTLIVDAPAANSFADNYTHGLVWVNDYKRSMTKEAVTDLTETPFFKDNTYVIQAQNGNATAGSEQRKISIAGDATSVHDQKVYVELRRPSIARSGNHTFEYLGFGPGNYSTGLPARQEVILSEFQDYYAQAKREDGGIVFYTGLNSNGDLYIGNKKIDAITGEETFLEKAQLVASEDDTDTIGTLITSFDTPVTFKDKITVEGISNLNNQVIINTQPPAETPSLIVRSNPRTDGGAEDSTLTRTSYANNNDGDITISRNKISSAIFHIKGRGPISNPGQEYSVRSNYNRLDATPNNRTPNQGGANFINANQVVSYYSSSDAAAQPQAGDFLYKGGSVENSGSLGWILANYYTNIGEGSILQVDTNGGTTVKIKWSGVLTNASNGIAMVVGKTIRIQGFTGATAINGKWIVSKADQTGADDDFIEFVCTTPLTAGTYVWDTSNQPNATLERSDANWKETGIIGGESIRTETTSLGEFKVGINTVARTAKDAHQYGFLTYTSGGTVYDQQVPRANLDVVGNAFISGKSISNANYMTPGGITKTETNLHEAFLVGGSSDAATSTALLRVSTAETRVGINASRSDLGDTLTVKGGITTLSGGATPNLTLAGDAAVNGGDITSTATTFNLINVTPTTVNFAGAATTLKIGDTNTTAQNLDIGTGALGITSLDIHTSSTDSTVNIGTVANSLSNKSVITLGGAFANTANSTFTIKNAQTILDGNLDISGSEIQSNSQTVNLLTRSGYASIVNFATRASQFAIGGVAGTTEIRNSLKVNGDTNVYGDVTMHGGSNSGTVTVTRARLGTTKVAHSSGSLTDLNVDFYKYVGDIDGKEIIVSVDNANGTLTVSQNYFVDGNAVRFPNVDGLTGVTTGVTYYIVNTVGNTFRVSTTEDPANAVSVTGTPGVATGLTLQNHIIDTGSGTTTWTGNAADAEYSDLPINNVEGINIGDILIIGTELCEVVSPGPDVTTRTVKVNRGTDCTTVAAHNDNETIFKLEKSTEATYLVGRLPQNSTTPAISAINDVTDTFEVTLNELQNGDAVKFSNLGNIVGADVTSTYFVVGAQNDTTNNVTRFQLSLDPDGAGIAISGTAGAAVLNFADDLVSLAEFGGQFSADDYLRLSASASCPSGEFVQITTVNDTNSEKFTVNNGANQDRFVIDSVYGGVRSNVLGTQDFTVNLYGDATSNSTDNQFQIINGETTPATRLTVDSDGKLTVVGTGSVSQPKAIIDKVGAGWFAGDLRVNLNNVAGSTTRTELSLQVENASGDTDIGGKLRIDDDFGIFSGTTGIDFGADSTAKFFVDAQTGDTRIGTTGSSLGDGDLTVNGGHVTINSTATATPSDIDFPLQITNLGVSANRNYKIRQDAAIDAFGVTKFYNENGGKHWVFATTNLTCQTGKNYMISITADTVFTLPSNAVTGDIIRFIEVGGALSYDISLIVRAPVSVAIGGDTTGTQAGGLSSPYQGGELIVQTRNAGFGLVYAGSNDSGNSAIPANFRGWWLVEI